MDLVKKYLLEGKSDVETFVKTINKLRTSNKNKWYTWTGVVDGNDVKLKGYNTWLQVFKVKGIEYGGPMEVPVSKFKQLLKEPF